MHFIKIAHREAYTKAPTDSFGIEINVHFDREAIRRGLSICYQVAILLKCIAFYKIATCRGSTVLAVKSKSLKFIIFFVNPVIFYHRI